MSMHPKILKLFKNAPLALLIFALYQTPAQASPWTKKEGYFNQTGGKFTHGLKHSLFSWMTLWTESREPGYKKHWEGFSTGVGKTVVYTAGGLIQLVTFPIPADFPDFGIGLHIPSGECPARHAKDYVPPAKNPLSKKAAQQAAANTALKPLTTPSTFSEEQEAVSVPAPLAAATQENLKPLTTPSSALQETEAAAVITEAKISEPADTLTPSGEKTDAEKAQEAELEALVASSNWPAQTAADQVTDVKSIDPILEKLTASTEDAALESVSAAEQIPDDKIPESNEDVVSATPQNPKETGDEEALWDEEDSEDLDTDDLDTEEIGEPEEKQASAVKPAV